MRELPRPKLSRIGGWIAKIATLFVIGIPGSKPVRSSGIGAKMSIERTAFGTITIDGKTYEHDVIIRLSGKVDKRQKKLSKKQYGTSHVVSKAEAKSVFEDGCDLLIIGSGQVGNVNLSPEASTYLEKRDAGS